MSVWSHRSRLWNIRAGAILLLCGGLVSVYVFVATAVSVVFPAFVLLAIMPALLLMMLAAPEMKPVPPKFTRRLVYIGAAIMPLWPVYLHIKLGPLPIITPTRVIFYGLIAIWLYEMACVPRRRL